MPHTPENFKYFSSFKGKGVDASYLQVRATCLVNTHSHEMLDAQIGDMTQGELTLARDLNVLPHSITLFDRAYFSADFLLDWQQAKEQSHLLMRAKDNLRYEVIEKYGKEDYHIRMPISPRAQKLNPSLGTTWEARLIEFDYKGKKRCYIIITSLLDSNCYPK